MLVGPEDLARFDALRARLSVNDEVRQDAFASDRVETSIATDDGELDLGTPRNRVVAARGSKRAGHAAGVHRGPTSFLPRRHVARLARAAPRARRKGARVRVVRRERENSEAGLVHFRARHYDPWTGRSSSQDPELLNGGVTYQRIGSDPQQANAYAYVANRPTVFTDPTGRSSVVEGCGPPPVGFQGWHLGDLVAISDDGFSIIGNGSFRSGPDQAWIAVIPEPSTLLLLGFGLGALAARC